MFGLNDYIKAIEQGWHQRIGPLILVVCCGKQTKLIVNQALTEILPFATLQAIENETLFCLWRRLISSTIFTGRRAKVLQTTTSSPWLSFPRFGRPIRFFPLSARDAHYLTAPDDS